MKINITTLNHLVDKQLTLFVVTLKNFNKNQIFNLNELSPIISWRTNTLPYHNSKVFNMYDIKTSMYMFYFRKKNKFIPSPSVMSMIDHDHPKIPIARPPTYQLDPAKVCYI